MEKAWPIPPATNIEYSDQIDSNTLQKPKQRSKKMIIILNQSLSNLSSPSLQ